MKATAMGKLTRDDALSCSQLPALLRQDGYGKSPNDVLRRCTDAMAGAKEDFTPNEAMNWGSRLEEAIVEEAAERLGMELQHGFTEAFKSDTVPLQCSLDAKVTPVLAMQTIETSPEKGIFVLNNEGKILVDSFGCLEAKLTSYAPEDSPPLHRGPLQLQGQMICTGAKWGAIATLYRGTELRIFVFDAHPATQEAIIMAAREFEQRLTTYNETGVIEWYPLQDAEDGARTFPKAEEVVEELEVEAEQYVAGLAEANQAVKHWQERQDHFTARIMGCMGTAEKAKVGTWSITWGSRSYKAQPEKIVPAKPAYTVRGKTLAIKRG